MNTATLNLRVPPRRMLNERDAAEYVGLSIKNFRALVTVQPVRYPNGTTLHDMVDLDRWVESQKAGSSGSDDDILAKLK